VSGPLARGRKAECTPGRRLGSEARTSRRSSRWKQRFLVKSPASGQDQFLDKQWNSYTGVWEGYATTRPAHAGPFTQVCQLRHTQAGGTSTALEVPVYPAFVDWGEVGR
jgi:hypothetical protein